MNLDAFRIYWRSDGHSEDSLAAVGGKSDGVGSRCAGELSIGAVETGDLDEYLVDLGSRRHAWLAHCGDVEYDSDDKTGGAVDDERGGHYLELWGGH